MFSDVIVKALDVESTRRGWLDLDRMLVQTWTSRSIRPRLIYERIIGERDLGEGCDEAVARVDGERDC